jgi:hypothetical protein
MFSLILDGAILGSGLSEITPMSSPSPNTDLETGLAAISQKQYTEAIALLEPIATAYPQRSRGLRANMGLVVAYEHTGEVQKAIALCRQLTQSSQEKVKQWADRRLQALEKRYLTAENPTPPVIETGFMAFDPSLQPPKVQAANSPPLSPPKVEPPRASQQSKPSPIAQPEKQLKKGVETTPQASTQTTVRAYCNTPQQPTPQPLHWQNAPRAEKWPRLKQPQFWRFRLEQILTVIALLWFMPRLVEFFMDTANDMIRELPLIRPLQLLYRDPTQFVYLTLGILFIFSPWILDSCLKIGCGFTSLTHDDSVSTQSRN